MPDAPPAVQASRTGPGAAPDGADGAVEFHARLEAIGAWLICGWTRGTWTESTENLVQAGFAQGTQTGTGITCFFRRPDLPGQTIGFALVLYPAGPDQGPLLGIDVRLPRRPLRLPAPAGGARLPEIEAVSRCQTLVAAAPHSPARAALQTVLTRSGGGNDTLGMRLRQHVQFAVDECIAVPPGGLVLIGWMVDALDCVRRVRVRCGARIAYLNDETWIRIPRKDIADTVGAAFGAADRDAGFIAFLPEIMAGGEDLLIEIETTLGQIDHRPPVPRPRGGLAAMQHILDGFTLSRAMLAHGFDHVIGPAIAGLNAARMTGRPEVTEIGFGLPARAPAASIIVPLHGRPDFMEHQLAQFSADPSLPAEILYVLDDPPRRAEAEEMAESCHARFGLPFRLLLLDRNMGFPPTCNIGAGAAGTDLLCFLNSDVFPAAPGWLSAMIAALRSERRAGIVGARLLYEDGTLQHDGCTYEANPDLGGWHFPTHPGKGRVPLQATGRRSVPMVTGACLLIGRTLFAGLGGFDESYAVGDFEDSDLCQKVRARGLSCLVCDDVTLFHLERQSQATPDQQWRANLTLYNAWQHEHRWGETIARQVA